MANLSNEVKKLLGENCHAETSYATLVVEYSPEFAAMLRPFPTQKIYDFALKHYKCVGCQKIFLVIAPVNKECPKCEECIAKEKKNEKKPNPIVHSITG